ncbi:MAG: GTPase Era [Alphaproteobacteria bacterium]
MTKCGFVTVFGLTNAGKSTLVNQIVGAKVSITSHKVQTTRNRVLGIAVKDDVQIILQDTPGIFQPKRRLDKAMVHAAWQETSVGDITIVIVDSQTGLNKKLRKMLERLKEEVKTPLILALNKIDTIERDKLLSLSQEINQILPFEQSFMISALKGSGINDLTQYLCEKLPEGPWHFPEDQLSDLPMRLLAAEITREKVYNYLHQELPYSIAVENDVFKHQDDGSIRIEQVIFVERKSQRAIVLGHKGQMIKNIGKAARLELTEILETKVHLFLQVRIRPQWSEERSYFEQWGLDFSV